MPFKKLFLGFGIVITSSLFSILREIILVLYYYSYSIIFLILFFLTPLNEKEIKEIISNLINKE